MYYTPETLLNHVFEDLRRTKAPTITDPARRREEGTSGDGGEDDSGARGRAGGPFGRSAEDGGDVPVHVESWRRTCFRSTTSVVPSS
jgi:hypothetical protein